MQDQLIALLVPLLQPRGLLLGTLPGLGHLLQLCPQHHSGIGSILQSLVQLGRCAHFSGFEGLGVIEPQLNQLRLEILVAGLEGVQLILVLPVELVLFPCNRKK